MLESGQLFAHFKIIAKIGEGGMGAVYLAEDQKLHRKVTIKNYIKGNDWYNSFQNFTYYMSLVQIDSSYASELRPEFEIMLENFKSKVPSNLWHIADNMLKLYDAGAVRDTAKKV